MEVGRTKGLCAREAKILFGQMDLKWIPKSTYIGALPNCSHFEGKREIAVEIL